MGRSYRSETRLEKEQSYPLNLRDIPQNTGIYTLLDTQGKPLYIGKAKNLRKRVKSHFEAKDLRHEKLSTLTADVDWIVTDNEMEALILENNLIKENNPRYNIQLKDDKSYPWLKITDEKFPALLITRRKKDDNGKYFGPYGDVGALRKTVRYIRKVFPIRNCSRDTKKEKTRVCLDYHIGRCAGPCERKIDEERYKEIVENVIRFLKGKNRTILEKLQEQMREASNHMKFNRASKLKKRIKALNKTVKKQRVVFSNEKTLDAIGFARGNRKVIITTLFIRRGRLVGQTHFTMEARKQKSMKEIITTFISQYYTRASFIPPRLITGTSIKDSNLISSWLSNEKGDPVLINIPKNKKEQELLSMAKKNAKIYLDKEIKEEEIEKIKQKRHKKALKILKEKVRLPSIPKTIEGYDVSNIQGAGSTGSKVCFKNGTPKKSHYRRYNLEIERPDDYAMMFELVSRRFKKIEDIPDLLLIDGGKGQVSAAANALKEKGVDIPLLGLAKKSEQVYSLKNEIGFSSDSPALLLLKQIRDEAHRFAITYHRKLRKKSQSQLDQIPGIGDKKKARLMLQFGSLEEIKVADKEELQKVEGIGEKIANKIYTYFHD